MEVSFLLARGPSESRGSMGSGAAAPVAVGPARMAGTVVPVRWFWSSSFSSRASGCIWSPRDRNAPGFLRFWLLCRPCGPRRGAGPGEVWAPGRCGPPRALPSRSCTEEPGAKAAASLSGGPAPAPPPCPEPLPPPRVRCGPAGRGRACVISCATLRPRLRNAAGSRFLVRAGFPYRTQKRRLQNAGRR